MRSGFQKSLASCVRGSAANLHGAVATLDEIVELIRYPTAVAPSSIAEGAARLRASGLESNQRAFAMIAREALRRLLVARSLERIGDNAVDVAEQVAFLTTGRYADFTNASSARAS